MVSPLEAAADSGCFRRATSAQWRKEFDQRPGYQAFVVEYGTDYDPIEAFLFLGEFLFSTHENRWNLVLIFSVPQKSKSLASDMVWQGSSQPGNHDCTREGIKIS
jgi:hypothetical protein